MKSVLLDFAQTLCLRQEAHHRWGAGLTLKLASCSNAAKHLLKSSNRRSIYICAYIYVCRIAHVLIEHFIWNFLSVQI